MILLPIYGAGEENIYGVTSESLAERIGKNVNVCNEKEIEKIVIEDSKNDETFIFMGAGSVSRFAHEVKEKIKKKEKKVKKKVMLKL